jgi:hypothetical protein
MRIARDMKTLLAGLFGPSPLAVQEASKDSRRKTTGKTGHKIGGGESLSPASAGNGIDRVTLSDRTAREVSALKNGSGARIDLPSPLQPTIDSNGTNAGSRTPGPTYADRPVTALLPASSINQQSSRPAADTSLVQESPETRRLVRSAYGSRQTSSRPSENESGSRIRVRA